MSISEPSWALRSMLLRTYDSLCHDHECLLAPMSVVGDMAPCSSLFMAAYECLWVLLWVLKSALEHSSVLMNGHGAMLMRAHGCSWAFMSTNERPYIAMNPHEHGTMAPTVLMNTNKHSWGWCHDNITTHNALTQSLSVLMSAQECSWVLLSASEYSRVIFSFQVLD